MNLLIKQSACNGRIYIKDTKLCAQGRKGLSTTPPISLRCGTSDLDCTLFSRQGSRLLVLRLQLVGKGEFGRLLLELGELVLVLGDLLEGGLHELALHVGDGHVELVDAEVAQDDLALQEEHLALEVVPLICKGKVSLDFDKDQRNAHFPS